MRRGEERNEEERSDDQILLDLQQCGFVLRYCRFALGLPPIAHLIHFSNGTALADITNVMNNPARREVERAVCIILH